jgi:D-sedoheptulose 7-phosphate isomerase
VSASPADERRRSGEARATLALRESAALFETLATALPAAIAAASEIIFASLSAGGTLLTCGNGGSAADAQHIAAELGGKFYRVRPGLPAVSLTVNTSMLTAIGNDFGYEEVFSRQLEAIGRSGDVLLAISTSGNSANVVKAVEYARTRGIRTIGLTGRTGGRLRDLCDQLIAIPSDDTARIQEGHIAVGHLLCELVETALFPGPGSHC